MEQILLKLKGKINPIIIFLKPISAAISIGTGGPFGAEGPIISTGGAFGSLVGQLMKVTPNERKILLAAGGLCRYGCNIWYSACGSLISN